jgi:2-succinyl-6-hydroxy-2,4-cyclohexadiene-1-carboxylate synthase
MPQRFRIVAVDLPGHGNTPLPGVKTLSLLQLADSLADLLGKLFRIPAIILGYSMGGRVALHLGLQHPDLIRALIMIGASPGIQDEDDRAQRARQDVALANAIRDQGIEWFAKFWEQQPIFASQQSLPDQVRRTLRSQRQNNSPEGLAFALENWSPGRQAYLLSELTRLSSPMLLLAGDSDKKYCTVNQLIEKSAGQAEVTRVEIPRAGHAVHLEQPEAAATVINDFLKKIQE